MISKLVTVVIPAYNCEKYIESAIESVLQQTYKEYELIVVDDGSTDNTPDIVLKYQDKLRYISQPNGGVSKARNTGIEYSNGKYIAFLDADDVWEKNKLEIQMACLRKYPDVGLISSNFRNVKNNKVFQDIRFENTFNIFKEYGLKISDIYNNTALIDIDNNTFRFFWGNIYQYLFLGNFILPSSVIFKKESLRRVGLLNENFRVAEETEFFLRFSSQYIVGFIDFPLLSYEIPDPDNLSGKKNTEKLIKNALKIQIDSILTNQDLYQRNVRYYDRGISMTYCRLAYYYLSEFRQTDARKYALYAIHTCMYYIKPYWIYCFSLLPKTILKHIAKYKKVFSS